MNNKCVNCRIRTKKGIKYAFCVRRKVEIEQKECSGCLYREFKKVAKIALKKPIRACGKKHKLTKATEISKSVKMKVWERDNHRCIFCQKEVEWNYANSHYIKRSQLGLGIEKNIMTNCERCHNLFEESIYREPMKKYAKNHFMSKYDDWNEEDLVYKKYAN
jgi:hypothetical protein